MCLFLPAVKLCDSGEPFPMVMIPFVWPLYLVGLFVALAAAAPGEGVRVYGSGLFVMIRVSAFGFAGSMLFELIDGQVGAEALIAIGVAVLAFIATWRPPTERAVAANSALAATGSFAFTLAIALERLAVWGAYVAVIAAGVLLAGTLAWCLETLVHNSRKPVAQVGVEVCSVTVSSRGGGTHAHDLYGGDVLDRVRTTAEPGRWR